MAFVEQFADVEAVDSVLPGSERVSDSGSESEFEDRCRRRMRRLVPVGF